MMRCCMSCWLPTRLLSSGCGAGGGVRVRQARDGVLNLCCLTTQATTQLGQGISPHTKTADNLIQRDTPIVGQQPNRCCCSANPADRSPIRNVSVCLLNQTFKGSVFSEMNSKRTRELLSPPKPAVKKKVKCSHNLAENCGSSPDFIPLSQDFSAEENCFIIDTRPSEACLSGVVYKNKRVDREEGVESASSSVNGIAKDRRVIKKNKDGNISTMDAQADDIDILYEGPSLKHRSEVEVVHSINAPAYARKQGILSVRSNILGERQVRRCHNLHKFMRKLSEEAEEVITLRDEDGREGTTDSAEVPQVNVLDPDVVQLDDAIPSTSKSSEVIEVYNSDHSDYDESTDSTDGSTVDVSNSDFVSLQALSVKDLENTEIEISDEVLNHRRKLEKLRKWDMTNLGESILSGRQSMSADTIFTVMSYNVLAQNLLTGNMYLYETCEKTHLSWDYRWLLLQHEIKDLKPDILLLQEVQASHYHSHYLPWLTYHNYEGLYKKRTGSKGDGCAIFYKKDKFSLQECASVEYLQPEAKMILDRDNIGLIAKLLPVGSEKKNPICVATTHLLYNPKRHDVKLAQMVLLLSEIDRLSYLGEDGGRTKYCPVVVAGDFNAEPHTTLLQFLKQGRLQYEGLGKRNLVRHGTYGPVLGSELIPSSLGITDRCQHAVLAQSRFLEKSRGEIFSLSDKRKLEEKLIHLKHSEREPQPVKSSTNYEGNRASGWISHGFNFNSVYRHRAAHASNAPEATTHQKGWTTVDYMLYSRSFSPSLARPVEGNLKLLARYRLLAGPEVDEFAPLPSSVCPSDHFPLAAHFLLRK